MSIVLEKDAEKMEQRPESPWIMTQTWENLLFVHWEISPQKIKPLIPPELELDLYKGSAWISVLPFKVTHQRFRGLPEIPFLHTYLELNVRTYVKYRGFQGVYFFSLDANHPLTVLGAKALALPYKHAKMNMFQQNKGFVFKSRRVFGNKGFSAVYEPVSPPMPTEPGSLDHWLLERYCLFTKWGKILLRGDIRHEKWEISAAKALLEENTVTPFEMNEKPGLLHYSCKKETLILPFKKV
jgi:uncharacterized protein YqjF (DUF2071 family)